MTIAPLDRPCIEPPFTTPAAHEYTVKTKAPGCLLVIVWVIVCWVGYGIGADIDPPEFASGEWPLKVLFYFAPCIAAFMVVSGIQAWFETRSANQSAKGYGIAMARAQQSHQAHLETLRRSTKEQSLKEAGELAERLRKDINIAIELRQHYWNLLDESRRQVQQASWEFDQTAFGVFWDRIEDAIDHFNRALDVANGLSALATSYYQALQGRQHSFPAFPVERAELAWAGEVLSEIQGASRNGERNVHATGILEQRRTRAVLIAGFKTIDEAVRNIGPVMCDSMRRFERSVSDDVARNVIDEIRRMEQERLRRG